MVEEEVDTGANIGGNHRFRVWKWQKMWKNCIFEAIEQAGTNLCSIGYQNTNFMIGLNLYGCAENILNKVHSVQYHTSCRYIFGCYWRLNNFTMPQTVKTAWFWKTTFCTGSSSTFRCNLQGSLSQIHSAQNCRTTNWNPCLFWCHKVLECFKYSKEGDSSCIM